MKRALKYWIKERQNPQTGTYYVAWGQLSKSKARCMETSLYGENIMHSFDTETAYKNKIAALIKSGESVQIA